MKLKYLVVLMFLFQPLVKAESNILRDLKQVNVNNPVFSITLDAFEKHMIDLGYKQTEDIYMVYNSDRETVSPNFRLFCKRFIHTTD